MLKVLDSSTRICVACDLNMKSEFVKTLSVLEWKKDKPDLNKRPCIFIIESFN
jgi:16S rRNA (cytidine1402-2'-O)-methyltransferase